MMCQKCHRVFCVDCDFLFNDISRCCVSARDEYYNDHELPEMKLKFKKTDEKQIVSVEKVRVNIQEVGDGNL